MQFMNIGYQIMITWDILLEGTATVWYLSSVLFRGGGFVCFCEECLWILHCSNSNCEVTDDTLSTSVNQSFVNNAGCKDTSKEVQTSLHSDKNNFPPSCSYTLSEDKSA